MDHDISVALENQINADELLAFYARQEFATTHSKEKLQRMLNRSSCVVTARKDGTLIGFARGVTDGVRGQLVECKLDSAWQGPGCITKKAGRIEHDDRGIAREMALQAIDALKTVGVQRIDVMAHGTEVDFCEELGFRRSGGIVALHMEVDDKATRSATASASVSGE